MFPDDSSTLIYNSTSSGSDVVLTASDRTVLNVSISSSNSANIVSVDCDSDPLFITNINTFVDTPMSYFCNSDISISRLTSDPVLITITSVPRSLTTLSPTDIAINLGLGQSLNMIFLFFGIIIFVLASWVGTNIFRR